MSLKAKIEAVIYASEEPVTLAQLIGLLGEEGQTELDALRSRQSLLALYEPEADDDALNAEVLNSEVLDGEVAEDAEPEAPAEQAESEAADTEVPAAAPAPSHPDSTSEADEKRIARDAAVEARSRERALRDHFRSLLEQLISDYANNDRGLEIREVAGGYRLATKPEYHDAVRGFVKSLKPPLKLSLQALETLAVVAYKQPVTAPEISEIRGVDSGGVLGGLMARKLVTTAGRKQVIGRPILYKTTKDFLVRFGLKDVNELPSIEEFEKMAGELADADPVQEEIQMEQTEAVGDQSEVDGHSGAEESQPLDETNSAPEGASTLHDTPEEMVRVEVAGIEPGNPADVEPMADVHEPQSDGNSSPTDVELEEGNEAPQPQETGA